MKVKAYTRCPRCTANVGVYADGRMVVHVDEHPASDQRSHRCRGSNRSRDEVLEAMTPETREHRGLAAVMKAFEAASEDE